MKLIVSPHKIEIDRTPVNEKEINVTKVKFEFSDEITESYTKEAYFTLDGESYKVKSLNNEKIIIISNCNDAHYDIVCAGKEIFHSGRRFVQQPRSVR